MEKEKKPGIHVIPKPPIQKVESVPITEEWMRRIAPVLEEGEAAPNEFVGYLVEQVNAANDERTTLLTNLRQASSQINQMRERVTTLDGQINARLSDMRAWWDRTSGPTVEDDKPFILKPESEKAK